MKWPVYLTCTKASSFDPWSYCSIPFLLGITICLIIYFIKKERFTSNLEKNNFINIYPQQPKKEIYNLTASELPL